MGVSAAIVGAGALAAGASVYSGMNAADAAKSAAGEQQQAAEQAAQLQASEFGTITNNLQPFVGAGTTSLTQLQNLTGTNPGGNPLTAQLTKPFQPTMAQLAQTPGYQFTLNQGLESTQNSFAAQGLASSGAALKGASNYAEGLASNTFQQQFQNYLGQNQQIYNMLQGQVSTGENAAAQVGTLGNQSVAAQNALTTGGAAAGAAGTVGAANALTGALGNISGSASNTALLYALNNGGMFSGTGGGSNALANYGQGGLTNTSAGNLI